MAMRLLLTLLALLTGLAAQFAPAQARVCGSAGTEIGASIDTAAVQVRAAAVAARDLPSRDRAAELPLFIGASPVVCQASPATVLQGIDRARE